MSEREKLMAGLECLTHVNFAIYKSECQERNCPYKDTDCDQAVLVDAYNLLTNEKLMCPDGVNKYDNVEIDPPIQATNNGIIIHWRSPEFGWGEFMMWWEDGHLHMDTEHMSDEFVQAILGKLIGQMIRED